MNGKENNLSHLSEMPTVRAHRQHHTVPIGLCGVNCTACVTPLRGFESTRAKARVAEFFCTLASKIIALYSPEKFEGNVNNSRYRNKPYYNETEKTNNQVFCHILSLLVCTFGLFS
jgi:hypothetical protein